MSDDRNLDIPAKDGGQPWIDSWPLREEDCSKIPVFADIAEARLKLAHKFNRSLPRQVEVELAWREHARGRAFNRR